MLKTEWHDFQSYLYWQKGLSKNTSYQSRFMLIKSFFSNRELNKENIRLFFQYLHEEKKFSNATLNNYLKLLRHLTKFLGDPYTRMLEDQKKFKEVDPIIETLTETELDKLIECAYSIEFRVGLFTEILSNTAIRIDELVNLKFSDFQNDDRFVIQETKNKRGHQVPIEGTIHDNLIKYRDEIRDKRIKHDYIAGGIYGQIKDETVNQYLKQAAKMAGITKTVTAHKLRHTYATLQYEETGDIAAIKEFLNHKDINSTMRYVHMSMNPLKKLNRRFYRNRKCMTLNDLYGEVNNFVTQYKDCPFQFSLSRNKQGEIFMSIS